MRSFDAVDEKLAESDYFLEELSRSAADFYRARFIFSAFASATRATTFALQRCLSGADGFSAWYANEQALLKEDTLARFFHECRTDAQHTGLSPICGGYGNAREFYLCFGQPEEGRFSYIPDVDVVTASRAYMKTICGVVDRAYSDFGLLIDPDQIYTSSGLRQLGLSVEDFEEAIGFPRGFTDVDGADQDRTDDRLKILRRSIPGSAIKDLLERHLGRPPNY